ncbi:MAG: hypothetical protein AB8G05_23715 [Oligoflexales bacterium]
MKIKAYNHLISIFSLLYLYNSLFHGNTSYAQRRQSLSNSDLSSNEIPQVCQGNLEEHQQAFFTQLETALETGNEKDLVLIITQFANSGCLFSDTFVEAFRFLVNSNNETGKEKLAEYFTKPMIEQLSKDHRSELCKHLLQNHSKKYQIDIAFLEKSLSERESFFRLILNCLREAGPQNLETASILLSIDKNFISPKLLACLINKRTNEQIDRILRVFYPYDLISDEVLSHLNQAATDILTEIDLELILLHNEVGSIDHLDEYEPEDMDMNSDELFSMLGMLVKPKQLLEQTIKTAKESPEAMITACIAAIDEGDQLFFPVLLEEALRMLDANQVIYLLDYAAASGVPMFVGIVCRIAPNFDQIPLFSPRAKSNMLAAKKSEEVAISIASAYWSRVVRDKNLQLSEQREYEQILNLIEIGLAQFIVLEEYPPYSQADLKTLNDYLLDLINNGKISFHQGIDSQTIFDICKSWGEKLKQYGLVASMKTQNPYY